MTADLPQLSLGYAEDGAAAIFVDGTPIVSMLALTAAEPWLFQPDQAVQCARVVNHLAQEQSYTVIEDPEAFAQWYRDRFAKEDPAKLSPEGGFGLRNFGMPVLDDIAPPSIAGATLTFYAVNRQIGAPYKVTAKLDGSEKPDYDPMPMTAAV